MAGYNLPPGCSASNPDAPWNKTEDCDEDQDCKLDDDGYCTTHKSWHMSAIGPRLIDMDQLNEIADAARTVVRQPDTFQLNRLAKVLRRAER